MKKIFAVLSAVLMIGALVLPAQAKADTYITYTSDRDRPDGRPDRDARFHHHRGWERQAWRHPHERPYYPQPVRYVYVTPPPVYTAPVVYAPAPGYALTYTYTTR